MIKSKDIFSLAAAAAGIFAVFGSSIFFTAIISDDILYVSRFHQLEFSWSNLFFWLQPVMALRSPLPAYTFMLDYLIWGREFFLTGAHLGNILLHLTAAAGVFAGMRWLKFPAGAALAGTLLWALHPQRAESVAWLSERKDVLLLALTVWSIVFFIRSMQKHRFAWYVLSLLFFLLTFAVKPGAIGLPVILTAFLWGRYRSKNVRFYVKYTGVYYLISLICFLSFFLAGNLSSGGGENSPVNTLAVIFWRFSMYWQKTFVPINLNPCYPHFSLVENSLLPLLLSGIAIIILLMMIRKNSVKALYLYLPLLISYSAAVSPALLRIGDVDLADRYSYFPSIFLMTGVVAAFLSCCRRFPEKKTVLRILLWSLVAAAGISGYHEVQFWKSNDTWHNASLQCRRPNYRVLITEAVKQYIKGDYAQVCRILDRLESDYTDHSFTHRKSIELFSLSMEGMLLLHSENPGRGISMIEKALRDPNHRLLLHSTWQFPRMVMLKTAEFYLKNKMHRHAAEMYQKIALWYREFEPLEEEFYLALSALCFGDKTRAVQHFENALKFNPEDLNIRRNIGALKKETK